MKRAYYSNTVAAFLEDSEDSILGALATHHEFALEERQKNSWISQIRILKERLSGLENGHILFEYSIPRMGKRVDVVLLLNNIVFVLEFKVGTGQYEKYAIDQALDYSLDLKNFHEQSHNKKIVPIVVATEAVEFNNTLEQFEDSVFSPLKANKHNLLDIILSVPTETSINIDPSAWEESIYKPTPTIIEAAQALYKGHSVKEISRADSDTINLSKTSDAIATIIDDSKLKNDKSICFITGVPGAGKTLAGLNIANERHNIDEGEHAVFLSGNGPLVLILQEALARNEVSEKKYTPDTITKSKALSKTKAFIQNIHHFRDDSLQTTKAPIERVAVFDEAQRAWTLEQTRKFMKTKKGIQDFDMSEPEFLISVMDRHEDWSIIICLIGGGQEINTGEAGLPEWFSSIQKNYPHWNVYVSDKLTDQEYTRGNDLFSMIKKEMLFIQRELHLSVSVRSYRSEKVSALVKSILDCNSSEAKRLYSETKNDYPLLLTRNIEHAKDWLRSKSRGTERCGIIASSGAYRLKPYGIHIKAKIDPVNWFLNDEEDVRSSYFLEDVATEFDIQGLELDWICVAWDANFRFTNEQWEYKNFRGTSWQNINDETRMLYLKNAYRVLLTRARQGMIIFIPEGDDADITRIRSFYNTTYNYLQSIGISCI
ncbi:MAG: DUF2075 domain-containing protein [Candidatus Brocadiaceae bacterium]|nr:DUF2075 domain-containing protein [Candidatus Brocadiaceae bacterium]